MSHVASAIANRFSKYLCAFALVSSPAMTSVLPAEEVSRLSEHRHDGLSHSGVVTQEDVKVEPPSIVTPSHDQLCAQENQVRYMSADTDLDINHTSYLSAIVTRSGDGHFDYNVLRHHHINLPLPPASLTKYQTAYDVFLALKQGDLSLDEIVKIPKVDLPFSHKDYDVLQVGDGYTVESLLRLMLVQSNNLAATALAYHLSGDEDTFVESMNQKAYHYCLTTPRDETSGLTSHYKTASGLPSSFDVEKRSENKTALEMMILAARLYYDFPQYRDLLKHEAVKVGGLVVQPTTLKVSDQTEARLVMAKTGTVQQFAAGGYCNSLITAEEEKDGALKISVVMCGSVREYAHRMNELLLNMKSPPVMISQRSIR